MLNDPNSFVIFCFIVLGVATSIAFAFTSFIDGEYVMAVLYLLCLAGILFGVFV